MGKKAVNLLVHTILIILTLVNVLLTVLAMLGAITHPAENGFMALMALGLPALLVANLFLVVYWLCRRRWWFVMPLICLGLNYQYYPRIFQWPSQDRPVPTPGAVRLKVATYNVNYFRYDEELPRTVDFIARFMRQSDVDVVCFQEFDSTVEFTPDSIASALGLPHWATGVNSVDYPDIAVFSRFPFSNHHRMIFRDSPNSAMWVDLDVDGRPVRLFVAHLQTTAVNWEKDDLERQMALGTTEDQARAAIRISNIMKTNFRRRAYQAEYVAAVMDTTRMPVIYCGDTNDTPSSYVYQVLTAPEKKYTGPTRRIDGFLEAGHGYAYTFHNMKRLLRIDYVFYSPDFRGLDYSSPNFDWSDHNPVIMELELKN